MPGINLNAASGGLGKLAAAIGGSGSYDKAYQGEMTLQSKLAQALATMDAQKAAAEAHRAKAAQDTAETQIMTGRGDVGDELLAGAAGTDIPTIRAYRDQLRTGRQAMTSATGDAQTDEMIGISPAPVVSSAIAQAIAKQQPRFAVYRTSAKDMKADDLAKAAGMYREGDLSDDVIAGRVDATKVAQGQYAVSGKAPFSFHEFGTGNNLTGAVDDQNGPAQRFGQYRQAETGNQVAAAGAHRASAANSYASAAQHRASTEKVRQEIDIGARGVLRDTDQGLLLVNPRDGTAQQVVGPNGAPAGKPAALAKALPAGAAKGYLENLQNMERAQKALDLANGLNVGSAMGDKDATGWRGFMPNGILNRMDPEGVDTRAALADIGSMVIHDRSGAAVSASEFPRLQPFIPSVRDDAATVKKKLKLFVDNYKAIVDDQGEFYRGSGYNVPTLTRRNVAAPKAQGSAAPAAPGGFTYIGKE